jgi:tetratricopeptide (TPR) repeat protein
MADDGGFGARDRLVPPAVLARFEARIGEQLADNPPTLDDQAARKVVANLLARAGGADHYELLGVSVGATIDEITFAFTSLARQVHPSHAERLDLPEAVLRLVFEHATNAYLVLSDPLRRKEYDREKPPVVEVPERSPEELAAVRRDMARKCYRRARSLFLTEQFHYVVELMRDAVIWDPQPEHFALLAEAQGKNPRWQDEAVANMQEAIRLAPGDLTYRLKLAHLYEDMEKVPQAIAEYRAVLEKSPNQPAAMEGLERLGASSSQASAKKGWLR